MSRAIIPSVPGKTLHPSIICGFLLGAITGCLTTITTHFSGREICCLEKPVLSHANHLCHQLKWRGTRAVCIGSRVVSVQFHTSSPANTKPVWDVLCLVTRFIFREEPYVGRLKADHL